MNPIGDRRTPAEVEAAVDIRRHHTWAWDLLRAEVFHLGENTGLNPEQIAERLDVPWWWIAQQYSEHDQPLPYSLRPRRRRTP